MNFLINSKTCGVVSYFCFLNQVFKIEIRRKYLSTYFSLYKYHICVGQDGCHSVLPIGSQKCRLQTFQWLIILSRGKKVEILFDVHILPNWTSSIHSRNFIKLIYLTDFSRIIFKVHNNIFRIKTQTYKLS